MKLFFFKKQKGALTSKPYAFRGRSWELRSLFALDLSDSLVSNLRMDIRGTEVLRVLPQINEHINLEWISDRVRFFYDSLNSERIILPYLQLLVGGVKGKFLISWSKVFFLVKKIVNQKRKPMCWFSFKNQCIEPLSILGYCDPLLDQTDLSSIFYFFNKIGVSKPLLIGENFPLGIDFRNYIISNTLLENLSSIDLITIIGSNLRLENPIFAYKLEQVVKQQKNRVFFIGAKVGLISSQVLDSNSIKTVLQLIEGRHLLNSLISKSNKKVFLIGNSLITRKDSSILLKNLCYQIDNNLTKEQISLNIIPLWANSISVFELGSPNFLIPQKRAINSSLKLFWFFGYNTKERSSHNIRLNYSTNFIIYQSSHYSEIKNQADLVIPISSPYEKESIYINLSGIKQTMSLGLSSKVMTMEVFLISLMAFLGIFRNTIMVEKVCKMEKLNYVLSYYLTENNLEFSFLEKKTFLNLRCYHNIVSWSKTLKSFGNILNSFFVKSLDDFYLVTSLHKCSKILSTVSLQVGKKKKKF